jgi:ribA/ribD-fused uncharacterized protein
VVLDGLVYSTTEHAYQAAKTTNMAERRAVRKCATPGDAKRMGRKITLRPDWDEIKLRVMRDLQVQKYSKEPYKSLLKGVRGAFIEEGNTWGDTFWGVCRGKGRNELGKILMEVADDLGE